MEYKNPGSLNITEYSSGQTLDVYNCLKNDEYQFKNFIQQHGLPTNVNLPYMMVVLNTLEIMEEFIYKYKVEFEEYHKYDIINLILCNGNLQMLQYFRSIGFDILNQTTFNLACDKSTFVIVRYLIVNSRNIIISDENVKRSFVFNNEDITTMLLHRLINELKEPKERFKYIYSLGISENSKKLVDLALTIGIPFPNNITCKEELLYTAIINKAPSVVKLLIYKYNTYPDFGKHDCLMKAIDMKLIYIIDILLGWYIKNNIILKIDKQILNLESIKDLITFDCIESASYIFYLYFCNNIPFEINEELFSLTEIHKLGLSENNFIGYVIMAYAKNNIDIQKPTQKAFSEFRVISKLISIGGLDCAIHYNLKLRNDDINFETIMSGLNNYKKLYTKSESKEQEFFEKLKHITGKDLSKEYKECINLLPFDDITNILVQYL